MKTLIIIASIFLIGLNKGEAQSAISVYQQPSPQVKQSDKFQVVVYQNNKHFVSYTYQSSTLGNYEPELGMQKGKSISYNIFSFSGSVTITVTKFGSKAQSARILPEQLGLNSIKTEIVNGNSQVSFVLNKQAKISVEFDDDPSLSNALVIFANALEDKHKVPDHINDNNVFNVENDADLQNIPVNKSIIYFKSNLYNIGYWQVPVNIKQIYIAGGAYIRGYIYVSRKKGDSSILINGRGVISSDTYPLHYAGNSPKQANVEFYKTIMLEGANNSVIDGVTIVAPTSWGIYLHANYVKVNNVNILSWRWACDGINTSGRFVTVDSCFVRANDDNITLSGCPGDITIENCIFWPLDNGSVIQFGWRPHSITGINLIRNIEVLHSNWSEEQEGDRGFITSMNTENKPDWTGAKEYVVENFTVENIYFDDPIPRFIDIRPDREFNGSSNKNYPVTYNNFVFKNITLKSNSNLSGPLNYLKGFDVTHGINGFSFENVIVNGNKLTNTNLLKRRNSFMFNKEAREILKVKD